MDNKFYVYKWFNLDTGEVFYIGKGCRNRYKATSKRNKYFLEYIKTHNTKSEIILDNLTEKEAFEKEKVLTDYYRSLGQCSCCLMDGGFGGYSSVWTDTAKQYKSEFNPMKNATVAQKVAEKNKRPVIINNIYYNGTVDAAKALNVWTNTVLNWCKRGYDTDGNPCRYADEEQKAYIKHKTCSKAVLIDGQEFPSLRAAADFLGVKDTSPLCRALKLNKPYHGHICQYANQQPSTSDAKKTCEGSTTNG